MYLIKSVLPNVESYKFSNTVLEDYEDITTVENINLYWKLTKKDYKVARKELQVLCAAIEYENLTTPEKLISAKWFAVSPSLYLSEQIITFTEFVNLGTTFNAESKGARMRRINAAEASVFCRLGYTAGNEIISEVTEGNLIFNYTQYGRDGIETGSVEGIWDYIQSTEGTTWEETGLTNKSYTPVDGTSLANVVTSLMSILRDGNY